MAWSAARTQKGLAGVPTGDGSWIPDAVRGRSGNICKGISFVFLENRSRFLPLNEPLYFQAIAVFLQA
jgi:hypothetical protein